MKHLLLLGLQIKSAFKYIPKILAGTAIFSLLIIMVAAGGVILSSENEKTEDKMKVAVTIDDDAGAKEVKYLKMAFDYIQNIESVNNVCSFTEDYTFDEAVSMLNKKEITAVIRVPAGFIDGILYGKNIPATIIFNEGTTTTSSMLLRYMMQAGAQDLSTAQAGIYAVEDIMYEYPEWIKSRNNTNTSDEIFMNTEELLNKSYFSYALNRSVYFEQKQISERGSLSIEQFYFTMSVVMLMLLGGITCAGFYKKDSSYLSVELYRKRFFIGELNFYKTVGITVVLFCIYGTAYILSVLATIRYPQFRKIFSIASNSQMFGVTEILKTAVSLLIGGFVLIFSIYLLVSAIYNVTVDETAGILFLFIFSVTGMFISGTIVPSSMLPEMLRKIGMWLPTYWYFKLASQIITGTVTAMCMIVNVLYGAVVFALCEIVNCYGKR